MGGWVAVVTCSKVTVERGDDGVSLALGHVCALPLTDAGTATVCVCECLFECMCVCVCLLDGRKAETTENQETDSSTTHKVSPVRQHGTSDLVKHLHQTITLDGGTHTQVDHTRKHTQAHLLDSTVPPTLSNTSIRPSRSIVARTCSEPGEMVKGTLALMPVCVFVSVWVRV